MEHTAAGVVSVDLPDWQIFMRFRKIAFDVVSLDPKHGQYLIPIENIMDGESIGKQTLRCGREKFSAPAQQMRVSHERLFWLFDSLNKNYFAALW